jgi:hypothetical protein
MQRPTQNMYILATVSLFLFTATVAKSLAAAGQQAPPVFHCKVAAGQECAYTIHDAHGTINLVLTGGQSHGYNVRTCIVKVL